MKASILLFLESRGTWVKRKELLQFLHGIEHNITDRRMRKIIEEMITKDGHLIASSEMGYKIITTKDELNRVIDYLNEKAEAIAIRKNTLISNFIEKFSKNERKKQLTLFEHESIRNTEPAA